jgi:hypothetical protein
VAISEPSTLLTDCLLAAVAFVLGARLWAGVPGDTLARRLWAAAFLVGAAAAAAGGTVHGLRASLPAPLEAGLWTGCLMAAALCGALLVAGASCHVLEGAARKLALVMVALVLAAELGLLFAAPLTRYAVWAGAFWIMSLLALVAGSASARAMLAAPMALGLALVGAGLVVQRAGWGLHAHFNQNDVAHVLMTVALWPFYRAGRSMGNEPRAGVQGGAPQRPLAH